MRSKYAFCVLAPLRQTCTRRQPQSAGLVAIFLIVGGASCSAGQNVSTNDAASDATPAMDAPVPVPDSETADATPTFEAASPDSAEAARIPLCLRLSEPDRPAKVLNLSADVRTGYLTLVAGDCRMEGLFPTRSATLAAWSNRLYDWNLDLWGCTDRRATGFALVHDEIGDLTSADAALLIDDYLLAANRTLKLSRSEATEMRQDVALLGVAAITRQSDEHPFSGCSACDAGPEADPPPGEGGCPSDATDAPADAGEAAGG
jgi:hypothetical protein